MIEFAILPSPCSTSKLTINWRQSDDLLMRRVRYQLNQTSSKFGEQLLAEKTAKSRGSKLLFLACITHMRFLILQKLISIQRRTYGCCCRCILNDGNYDINRAGFGYQ